jgi:hypothetical protein
VSRRDVATAKQDAPVAGAAEELAGGNMGQVFRIADEVDRPAGPWTPAVHALLRRLRADGISEVPTPHGVTAEGRERLEFLPGEVGNYPLPSWVWSPLVLDDAGRLLRRIHDAGAGLLAEADADVLVWRAATHEPVEVICHNDVAPYNLVYRAGRIVGLIDFDFASPGPRIWDLAYLAYRIVPLVGDERDGAPPLHEREARLRALIEAYANGGDEPALQPDDVYRVAAARLEDLAAFTDARAVETGRAEFLEHAALYRRDRDWLLSRHDRRG